LGDVCVFLVDEHFDAVSCLLELHFDNVNAFDLGWVGGLILLELADVGLPSGGFSLFHANTHILHF
jgi:hypothetical protein